ncbi:MAG: response regulator [Lachnospiraceae bacterium]|nr:response regulator [Lachnospiraceae bacterium]
MMKSKRGNQAVIAIAGGAIVALLLVLGTIWMGQSARKGTEEAVHSVSLLYLDELAGRREQVVANNLREKVDVIHIAVSLMTEDDLSDEEHLQAYQARMKALFKLEKFAFVDKNGLIYTSKGTQTNIDDYDFDYRTLTEPAISVLNPRAKDKKAIIAVPIEPMAFQGEELNVCFMEIDMEEMLAGVSMEAQESDVTFCNIYTADGIALSDTVLGGLAVEDNLLEAMKNADFDEGYSYDQVVSDFAEGNEREVSFTYNGIHETLTYIPVTATDWLLTYLVRESLISEKISSVSAGITRRSLIQSALTMAVLLAMFIFIFMQTRKNAVLTLETVSAQAEIRGKEEEIEQRIILQEKLEQQSQALSDALTTAEEASKAKTVFLSNMSHEIRTPLNAIIGLDTIALNDDTISDTTRGYLVKINSSATHLLNLINDILDMSRIESGRLTLKNEEFLFPEFLQAINTLVSSQCSEKGLDYLCRIEGEVDDYYIGDDMKLRQVLINILSNAVKFTPAGGKVTLTVRRMAQFDGHSTLCFRIADTGIGISAEYLPRIFDTFSQEDASSTNKYGSSGLGLAIAKNIVEMMNGKIEVESEKGKGSVFTVTVTLMDSKIEQTDAYASEIHLHEMSVLVVDDDPIACEHAKLVLEKAGIASEIAASGSEAIEMVMLRNARMDPYNLILIDWKMPEMDGVETTRRIREIVGNESAIIILTAYHWDDVLDEAVTAGVDSFLAKPIFAAAVMEEFRSAMKCKEVKEKKAANKADLTGRRILLAEDVQVNTEIMLMVLEMRQMVAEPAENGRIAVDMFAAHEPGYYDAILMDMRMPEMDGLTATRLIRAMDRPDAKSIPIIALTANAFDEDVQRSMQAGLNAHLSKPVQAETLFETLEDLIKD